MKLTHAILLKIHILALSVMVSPSSKAIVNAPAMNSSLAPGVALLVLAKHQLQPQELFVKSLSDLGVCSGAFISDRLVITAGHCLKDESSPLFPYLAKSTKDGYQLTAPLATATDYVFENLENPKEPHICTPGPKPLPYTQTSDVALLLFKPETSAQWFAVESSYKPNHDDKLVFFGYGTDQSPFDGVGSVIVKSPQLRMGSAEVWRYTSQRVGFVNYITSPFAADGDSGGPILFNGKIIAVLSTISERCETEFGEDYAILNTGSLLSDARTKQFFKKTLTYFKYKVDREFK